MSYHYQAFGLTIESEISCPELWPVEPGTLADVVVRYGTVPESLGTPCKFRRPLADFAGHLLNLPRVARFLARDGSEIVVQPRPDASEDTIRTFLLSACLSVLLHQRRLFSLHCGGVHTDRGAVLFSGHSGMGKSTLVSAFLERGYRILADDMIALTFGGEGQVMALSGFPQVKLWADAAKALGRSTEGLRRVLPEIDRFFAPEVGRFDPNPSPLRAVYFLRTHSEPEFLLELLDRAPRFNAFLDHTTQKLTLPGLGLREWHFQTAARIASLTYAARFTRPHSPLDIRGAGDLIEADLRAAHVIA